MHRCYRAIGVVLLLGLAWVSSPARAADEAPKPKKFREPDSVYVGTPHDVVMRMMDMAKPKPSDLVYDLGCGDGRMVVMTAKFYGCQGVGYEIDPKMVRRSLETVKHNGVEKLVKIEQDDVFTIDLQKVDVLLLYLLPSMMHKLVPQIQKMPAGARVVVHDYGLDEFAPDEVVGMTSQEDNARHVMYVYTLPLKPVP
jgi:predicted RNA methylase